MKITCSCGYVADSYKELLAMHIKKVKKCTCKKHIEDWTFHKYKKCVRCGGEL